jgi:hypothetical protein
MHAMPALAAAITPLYVSSITTHCVGKSREKSVGLGLGPVIVLARDRDREEVIDSEATQDKVQMFAIGVGCHGQGEVRS